MDGTDLSKIRRECQMTKPRTPVTRALMNPEPHHATCLTPARRAPRGAAAVVATIIALLMAGATTASAEPQGHVRTETGIGYFYGTFDQDPNVTVLVGGTAEEFCLDNPEDPFNAEPGTAPLRVFPDDDGSVDLRVDDNGQPIHLYYQSVGGGPEWIEVVCAAYFADGTVPEPFASGTAHLKVRLTIDGNVVDVFNSVNGIAVGDDGTAYKVRAWADLVVVDGVPQGNPEDFVGTKIVEIRR